jgi:hypothetical protein
MQVQGGRCGVALGIAWPHSRAAICGQAHPERGLKLTWAFPEGLPNETLTGIGAGPGITAV